MARLFSSDRAWCLGIWLCFLLVVVDCRIEKFDNLDLEQGESISNKIVFLTKEDSIIGSTSPTFTVNQTFSLKDGDQAPSSFGSKTVVTALFFPVVDSGYIGKIDDTGMLHLCCTSDLIEDQVCDYEGQILIDESDDVDLSITREDIQFLSSNSEIHWDKQIEITESGVYELLYINCETSGLENVIINGNIEYINPFGQLSAESYPLLWFFGIMTFVMIIVGTIWGVFMLIYRNSLISLQHFLSLLLVLEFIESLVWFLMLWVSNRTGTIHWAWLTATVLTSSVKRTAVGLLLLLISLGYGIMNKAKISDNKRLIIIIITFYFAVSTAQELVTTYIREGIVSSDLEVFLGFISLILLFPSVVIPLGLFWWICACLTKTIQKLKLRQQEAKLELYNKILISLIVAAIMTCLMIIMQTGVSIIDSDQVWRVWWLFTAFWFMVFFGLTITLLILLHPAKNETWLSYTPKDSKGLASKDDFSSNIEIELDNLEKDFDINFDFDLGFEDIIEEETSKLS